MSKINHPDHYNIEGRKECIVEMFERFGAIAVIFFCVLNAYKYAYRAGLKEGNSKGQDNAKRKQYINLACRKMIEQAYARRVISLFFPSTYKYILENLTENNNGTAQESN